MPSGTERYEIGRSPASRAVISRVTIAGMAEAVSLLEAHAVAEQMAERPARIGERCFRRTPRIEPGAQNAGDRAVEAGDCAKQGRPELERSVVAFAVVDGRVVAQGGPVERSGDATRAQIGLGRRAGNRAARTEETTCGLGRSARRRRCPRDPPGWPRQGEEETRLVRRLAETVQIAIAADQVQEIAMLAGGGIGPFAGGSGAELRAVEPDIEAAARRVHHVAGDPAMA